MKKVVDKKSKLGNRHECPECETRYYDLQKAKPACPKCGHPAPPSGDRPKHRVSTKRIVHEVEPVEDTDMAPEDIDVLSFDSVEEEFQEFDDSSSTD